ncbi:MAG: hypothetical protein CMA63_06155 [Euryarchaeota archaeon]|nr:hypothetical protein [Euryarchaeota archaeon]
MEQHYVNVDAGCIWIGDPCYVLGNDASSRVNDWVDDFCEKLDYDKNVNQPLGKGVGLCIDSGYGDGRYPVEVEVDTFSGRVKSVTISFIEDHYDDDDEENNDDW